MAHYTMLRVLSLIQSQMSAVARTLFLPAAGYRDTSLNNAGSNGNYWSRSLNSGNSNNAYVLDFNSSSVLPSNNNNRYYGQSVRPVLGSALTCFHKAGVHPL